MTAFEVLEDLVRARTDLGHTTLDQAQVVDSTRLTIGSKITVVPESDAIEFTPDSATQRWGGTIARFAFTATSATVLQEAVVRISIRVGIVEIASILLTIPAATAISSKPDYREVVRPLDWDSHRNSLAAAKLSERNASVYQRIFVSYSRNDTAIVAAYRAAQEALGNDVFMDTYSIRAGADWRAELAHGIDGADILQLLWSQHSARSTQVHEEWDYALRFRCPFDGCVGFIRPVYWSKPMPDPPTELSHLEFRFVELLQQS